MEKIFDFLTNNLVAFSAAIIGGLAPGVLTIAIFNKDFFVQIDFVKIILLACSICVPSLAIIFTSLILSFEKDKTAFEVAGQYITMALAMNAIIFDIAILSKIVKRSMDLKEYTSIVVIMCILMCVMIKLMSKDRNLIRKTKDEN